MIKKAMLVTVGTGRNREDIASAICFSIRQQNPEFVRFLTTSKSQEETIPLIVQDPAMKERGYDSLKINKEEDVEAIYQDCKKALEELVAQGYKVSADYTSGTKAMSAGLCMAAVSKETNTLIYVTGTRDEGGRVIPGTERAYSLSPTLVYIDQEHTRFKDLFNRYQFDACLTIAEGVKKRCSLPEVQEEWNFLKGLASAYSAWDRFDLETAFKNLNEIDKSTYLNKYGLKKKIEKHKEILYREKANHYCPERIVNLLQNAKRRQKEGKFDDAVARCYRCLEYLAQYRLDVKHNGIETRELDLEKVKDPVLKEKYKEVRSLSLRKAYKLLSDLGDPLGKDFVKDWDKEDSTSKKALAMRNDSILAHGFSPVGKDGYDKVLQVAEEYVRKVVENLDELERDITFPRL